MAVTVDKVVTETAIETVTVLEGGVSIIMEVIMVLANTVVVGCLQEVALIWATEIVRFVTVTII